MGANICAFFLSPAALARSPIHDSMDAYQLARSVCALRLAGARSSVITMRKIKFRVWDREQIAFLQEMRSSGGADYNFSTSAVPLMQFTGFLDKNGKVIKVRYGVEEGVHEATARIVWHQSTASFIALNTTSALPHVEPLHHETEVIGNITLTLFAGK